MVSPNPKPALVEPEPLLDEATKGEHEKAQAAQIAALVHGEISKLRVQAETEGRKAGEDEARRVLQSASSALQEAWAQLEAPLAKKEQDLADLATDLAFELACHIIGSEVCASAAGLKKLVTELVVEATAERREGQNILVRLNPVDCEAITDLADIENLNLVADPKISRGGALVEIFMPGAQESDKITWDATIEARIASIKASLALRKVPV